MDNVHKASDPKVDEKFPRNLQFQIFKQAATYRKLSRYSGGLSTGWHWFDSRREHDFALLDSVQTGSGVHAASFPMGTGWVFSEGNEIGE
jgi:hypothetical protein